MTNLSPLSAAAVAASDARKALATLDGHLARVREQSGDLDVLRSTLTQAREQRAKALADALIAGKKANIAKLDERCAVAVAALEKRQDECTAVDTALATLNSQREAAALALAQGEREFVEQRRSAIEALEQHTMLIEQYSRAQIRARSALTRLPEAMRDALTAANPDLPAGELIEVITAPAEQALTEAEQIADLPALQPAQCLGYVWKDGSVHAEPEPLPEPVALYAVGLAANNQPVSQVA